MTNRERISEMKVVDFFEKFVLLDDTFTAFIAESIKCKRCPLLSTCNGVVDINCLKKIDSWLDKEVSE